MTTYKPTKEELEELGFEYDGLFKYFYRDFEKYPYAPFEAITYHDGEWKLIEEFGHEFYPRSREHLESIILAFTPGNTSANTTNRKSSDIITK